MKKSDRRLRLQSPVFVGTEKSPISSRQGGETTSKLPGLDSLSDCIWKRNSDRFKSSLVTGYLTKASDSSNSSQGSQSSNSKHEFRGDFALDWKNVDQGPCNSMIERRSTQMSPSRKVSEPTGTFSCLKLLHCFAEKEDPSLPSRLAQEQSIKFERNPFPVNMSNYRNDFDDDDYSDQSPDENEDYFSCEGGNQTSFQMNSEENANIHANPRETDGNNNMQVESENEYKDCENPSDSKDCCGIAHDVKNQDLHEKFTAQLDQYELKEITAEELESKGMDNRILKLEISRDFQTVVQNPEAEQTFAQPEIGHTSKNCQGIENQITEILLSDKPDSESEFLLISDDPNDDAVGEEEQIPKQLEECKFDIQNCSLSDHGSECNKSFEILKENNAQDPKGEENLTPELAKEDLSKLEEAYEFL